MPKSCAVYECSATSENEKNRSFHQFPKDPKLRQAWIARIRRDGYNPSASSYVCSFHFSEEDVNKGSFSATPQEFKKKTVKKGSIPWWNLRRAEGDQRISSRTTLASQSARCSETPSSPIDHSEHATLPSEWASMDLDTEPAASIVEHNPLEELKDALSMDNKHVAALEKALVRYKALSGEDTKNYTGLERGNFDAVKEMIDRFKPLTYWTGKADTSISSSHQLLMFLMRLNLDLPYFDLA